MSTAPSTKRSSAQYSVGPLPELELRNWPLIDEGLRSLVVVASTIGVGFLAGGISGSWPMGCLAGAVLALSMWPFWLPVRYAIRGRGIVMTCLGFQRVIPWRLVRRCRLRKRGVVLLFHDKELFFDGFRSKYIDAGAQREQLVDAIGFYQQPDPSQPPEAEI